MEVPELEPERDGLDRSDPRWEVPWLKGLRRVPRDATWPRYMTVPHSRAVGSLGAEFIGWAEARTGKPLRWWQRLVATRLLEVDEHGDFVWESAVLSTARQLGKSWLLRELVLWRIHQGGRFGEPQDVMHTGKDIAICKEVQRPARLWAKQRRDEFKVTEVNGQEEIQLLEDGSRWMIRAKTAVQGYSVNFAVVDEAWKVPPAALESDLIPTMVERAQSQLLLVSTAHRLTTALMLRRRALALADLEGGDGDLLIEWSAPHDAELDDLDGWRLASPHWTGKRQRMIGKQLEALRAGEIQDPDEPDPEASFRAQWLNQWPRQPVERDTRTQELLPAGLWADLEDVVSADVAVFAALEDDFGKGAAVALAAVHDDGRIEVDGWMPAGGWDSAVADLERLLAFRNIRELHVGKSMIERLPRNGLLPTPRPATSTQTAAALAVFRDLAAGGMLVHDRTPELDRAVGMTRVRESTTGLQLVDGPKHLIKAVVWAVAAAHRPARVMAVG